MARDIRETLTMIRDDAEADAAKRVEFTALGLGTAHGEQLAMIQALAKVSLDLLDRIEAQENS